MRRVPARKANRRVLKRKLNIDGLSLPRSKIAQREGLAGRRELKAGVLLADLLLTSIAAGLPDVCRSALIGQERQTGTPHHRVAGPTQSLPISTPAMALTAEAPAEASTQASPAEGCNTCRGGPARQGVRNSQRPHCSTSSARAGTPTPTGLYIPVTVQAAPAHKHALGPPAPAHRPAAAPTSRGGATPRRLPGWLICGGRSALMACSMRTARSTRCESMGAGMLHGQPRSHDGAAAALQPCMGVRRNCIHTRWGRPSVHPYRLPCKRQSADLPACTYILPHEGLFQAQACGDHR